MLVTCGTTALFGLKEKKGETKQYSTQNIQHTVQVRAYLHCRTQTQIPTQIRTPNSIATLYCTETVSIAQTATDNLIWFLDRYGTHYWDGYPYPDRSESGNVNKAVALKKNGPHKGSIMKGLVAWD